MQTTNKASATLAHTLSFFEMGSGTQELQFLSQINRCKKCEKVFVLMIRKVAARCVTVIVALPTEREGGGSSIVKVPGNVLSTRVHFFGILVWPRDFHRF